MPRKKDNLDPPESELGDLEQFSVRQVFALIPLIGPFLSELFNRLHPPPLTYKNERWKRRIRDEINDLRRTPMVSHITICQPSKHPFDPPFDPPSRQEQARDARVMEAVWQLTSCADTTINPVPNVNIGRSDVLTEPL